MPEQSPFTHTEGRKVGQAQDPKCPDSAGRFPVIRAHVWEMALEALPGDPGLLAPLAAFVPPHSHPSAIRRAACTNGLE